MDTATNQFGFTEFSQIRQFDFGAPFCAIDRRSIERLAGRRALHLLPGIIRSQFQHSEDGPMVGGNGFI